MTTDTDTQFIFYPGWTKDLEHAIIGGAEDQDAVNKAVNRLTSALGFPRTADRSRRLGGDDMTTGATE